MAKVPKYTYSRGPQIQGGNIRAVDSGAATMAGQMVEATRRQGAATQRALATVQNVASEWQQQMDRLQLTDAETKLNQRYRQRLFDTKTNNKLGASIGITQKETEALTELDDNEFYGEYSPLLRSKLETLNDGMKEAYLGRVQSFELQEAGRYEVKVVTNYLAETVESMTDAPIGNVEVLFDQAVEMRDAWSGQYPVKVQQAIDSGMINAFSQWAWDTPDLNQLKSLVRNNSERLRGIMGTQYDKIMPAILAVDTARAGEASRLKKKKKETEEVAKAEAQLGYLRELQSNQINLKELFNDKRLPVFGEGSINWFTEQSRKRAEAAVELPKYSNPSVWASYHNKALNGELTPADEVLIYREASIEKSNLTLPDVSRILSLNARMKKEEDKPINRAVKSAVRTVRRQILQTQLMSGASQQIEANAYRAEMALYSAIDGKSDEDVMKMIDPENPNNIINMVVQENLIPLDQQIQITTQAVSGNIFPAAAPLPQQQVTTQDLGNPTNKRKPGETIDEFDKRVGATQ